MTKSFFGEIRKVYVINMVSLLLFALSMRCG
jgi:hypothetical protein